MQRQASPPQRPQRSCAGHVPAPVRIEPDNLTSNRLKSLDTSISSLIMHTLSKSWPVPLPCALMITAVAVAKTCTTSAHIVQHSRQKACKAQADCIHPAALVGKSDVDGLRVKQAGGDGCGGRGRRQGPSQTSFELPSIHHHQTIHHKAFAFRKRDFEPLTASAAHPPSRKHLIRSLPKPSNSRVDTSLDGPGYRCWQNSEIPESTFEASRCPTSLHEQDETVAL